MPKICKTSTLFFFPARADQKPGQSAPTDDAMTDNVDTCTDVNEDDDGDLRTDEKSECSLKEREMIHETLVLSYVNKGKSTSSLGEVRVATFATFLNRTRDFGKVQNSIISCFFEGQSSNVATLRLMPLILL